MFDALTKVAKAAVNVATLPVSAAMDVVTFGGLVNDRDEPYTFSKAKRIGKDLYDVVDEIAK